MHPGSQPKLTCQLTTLTSVFPRADEREQILAEELEVSRLAELSLPICVTKYPLSIPNGRLCRFSSQSIRTSWRVRRVPLQSSRCLIELLTAVPLSRSAIPIAFTEISPTHLTLLIEPEVPVTTEPCAYTPRRGISRSLAGS